MPFFGTVQYSHSEHLKGLCIDKCIYCVHPKNPIILANLGEPILRPATFKGQVQKACSMWPQVKGALRGVHQLV